MIVGDRDGAPMVLVPGGTFTMGSNEGQPAEAPAHPVRLSTLLHRPARSHEPPVPHLPGRDLITMASPPGKWLTDEKARAEPETMPVVHVNFHDADVVCGLGRQADPDRGPMGNGGAVDRRPEISLG